VLTSEQKIPTVTPVYPGSGSDVTRRDVCSAPLMRGISCAAKVSTLSVEKQYLSDFLIKNGVRNFMGPEKLHLARTLFQLMVYRSDGFAFEQLFGDVLSYSRPDFKKIEPYGKQGDRGNDGYEPKSGRYFQVYAPKNPGTSKGEAIKKVAEDFEDKLIPHWSAVCVPKEYIFVYNDKYKGSIVGIEKTLAEIKGKHSLDVCDVYLSKSLEQEFIALQEDQIAMIVGGLPNWESIAALDYTVLGDVIRHIQNSPPGGLAIGQLVAPNFEEKIKFNGLDACGSWLRAKQIEAWQVDDFLVNNSEFARQSLRDSLANYYFDSIKAYPDDFDSGGTSLGDLRFGYIFNKIAAPSGNPQLDRLRSDAALVLMAKYFETCDIFEEPSHVAA
jgi:hypothetical protein